jgi:exosortase
MSWRSPESAASSRERATDLLDTSRVRASVAAIATWMRQDPSGALVALVTALLFVVLFGQPFAALASAWWNSPDAGHGLLLFPVALWLLLAIGLEPDPRGQRWLGGGLLALAVVVRVGAGTAAGLTLARLALVLSLLGLIVYFAGLRQLRRWWLPLLVFVLSIPIPDYLLGEVALPLQLKASELGAGLLRLRGVPVLLTGNVIRLPGHELFVTEACSGLRSLTSLVSMAVLMGGIMLHQAWLRLLLVAAAVVVAVLVNGVRVFLTGFLVLFVDPAMGEGFMHYSEGMLLFAFSMTILFAVVVGASWLERRLREVTHA